MGNIFPQYSKPISLLSFANCTHRHWVTVHVSSRFIVRRTLYDIYCPYISPEAMVKYTRRGTGHFVTPTENVICLIMCISGHVHIWILLSKLSMHSLNGTTHQWFQSYFEDCTQMCPIDGFLSSSCNLSCGVPQGSILT